VAIAGRGRIKSNKAASVKLVAKDLFSQRLQGKVEMKNNGKYKVNEKGKCCVIGKDVWELRLKGAVR
jgi:hypothetical protein